MFNFLDTLFGSFNLFGITCGSYESVELLKEEGSFKPKKIETMKHNLALDFSVDKDNRTITVKREFAAEKSLVWDAYTKSEILDLWWGPKPWISEMAEPGCMPWLVRMGRNIGRS